VKPETILNAMMFAHDAYMVKRYNFKYEDEKRLRQYHAFRSRLIRIDERNKMRIAELEAELKSCMDHLDRIYHIPVFPKGD